MGHQLPASDKNPMQHPLSKFSEKQSKPGSRKGKDTLLVSISKTHANSLPPVLGHQTQGQLRLLGAPREQAVLSGASPVITGADRLGPWKDAGFHSADWGPGQVLHF